MKEYLADVQEVMEQQQTGEEGLSSREAGERLQKYGKNKLKEGKKESLIHKFLMELKDPMVLILIAAAVISGITSAYSGESFADVIIIMIVVVINAVLGVFQESKAEKAIAALQEIAAAHVEGHSRRPSGDAAERGAGSRRYCDSGGRRFCSG